MNQIFDVSKCAAVKHLFNSHRNIFFFLFSFFKLWRGWWELIMISDFFNQFRLHCYGEKERVRNSAKEQFHALLKREEEWNCPNNAIQILHSLDNLLKDQAKYVLCVSFFYFLKISLLSHSSWSLSLNSWDLKEKKKKYNVLRERKRGKDTRRQK